MPSAEAIKQFLAKTVIPVGAAALTTWLFATVHIFNLFGITEGQVDGEIVQGITFGVSYGLSWLSIHHILKGSYAKTPRLSEPRR